MDKFECKVQENCEHLTRMREKIDNHESRIVNLETGHAVINVKLNLILGILSAVGVALCGVLVKMVF